MIDDTPAARFERWLAAQPQGRVRRPEDAGYGAPDPLPWRERVIWWAILAVGIGVVGAIVWWQMADGR